MNPFIILLFIVALIYAGYRLIKKEAIITVLKKEVSDLNEKLNLNLVNISTLKALENTINQLKSTNMEHTKEIYSLKSKPNIQKISKDELKIIEVIDPTVMEPVIEISQTPVKEVFKKKRNYKKKPLQ